MIEIFDDEFNWDKYNNFIQEKIKEHGQRALPEGWPRTCELCEKESSFSSVVHLICIDEKGNLQKDKHYFYRKPYSLLKSEINELGTGEHWICRWRKNCQKRQWMQIKKDTFQDTLKNNFEPTP